MMKKLMAWVGGMAMATAAVGCIEEREALPGEPWAWVVGGWVQGDWSEVELHWGTSNECHFEDWSCEEEPATFTLLKVECEGCDVVDIPGGKKARIREPLIVAVMPTTDEEVVVRATLRFDETGDQRTVEVRQLGDHEVGIEAQCRMIDARDLGRWRPEILHSVQSHQLRPCGETRTEFERALIFPAIRTFRGRVIFPFEARYPVPGDRTLADWSFSSGEARWGLGTDPFAPYFTEVSPSFTGTSVTVSGRMADGTTATAEILLPQVR